MRRRSGFTLVELLVALALIIFIMVILSEAYAASMASFRQLKAIGDLDAKLRQVSTVLRNDLQADHFEGKKRLSDPNMWADGPPREGFFRIWNGSGLNFGPNYVTEGFDGDFIASNRAVDHYLHFTAKKRGNKRGDFYTAQIGDPTSPLLITNTTNFLNPNFFGQPPDERYQDVNSTFTSQWAEIIYFMQPNGAFAGGVTPLYTLYRRQLLAVPNNLDLNWNPTYQIPAASYQNYQDISCKVFPPGGNLLYFNNPTDLTVPQRRFAMDPTQDGGVLTGTATNPVTNTAYPCYPPLTDANGRTAGDMLLNDVLSFEVKVIITPGGASTDLHSLTSFNPLFGLPNQPAVFDTWSNYRDTNPGTGAPSGYDYLLWNGNAVAPNKNIPTQIGILALEITIRIWDYKTEQARQITIVQDM
jgi:prepilin-type N-terminal cleavage/methylation domain-containing protein